MNTSNASVIDTAGNTVIATVAVGTNPRGVAVNRAGTDVYVANENCNNVSVINIASNTVTATVAVGTTPIAFGKFIGPDATATPASMPTFDQWGLFLLSSLLALGTALSLRRQRR